MSNKKKSVFGAFIAFLGLSELIFKEDKASIQVTEQQAIELNEKIETLSDTETQIATLNEELRKSTERITEFQNEIAGYIAQVSTLETENKTLRKLPGANSAIITPKGDTNPNQNDPISYSGSFIDIIQQVGEEFS